MSGGIYEIHVEIYGEERMNIHILIDRSVVKIMKLVAGRRRLFSRNIESPSFQELMKTIELKVPDINGAGHYDAETVTPYGTFRPAFKVVRWLGNDFPTIIYHHGNSEKPFKFRRFARNTFFNIFLNTATPVKANLIALASPLHTVPLKEYRSRAGDLRQFIIAIAVMPVLVENIMSQLKRKVTKPVIVSGISFGGFVTNLHRAFFNTADTYIPLLAGSAMDRLFFDSVFSQIVSAAVHENPEKMKDIMNFEEPFMKIPDKNVFPLLGRYDQFVDLSVHIRCYEGHTVNITELGHVTTAYCTQTMREHIFKNAGIN